jgi:hypothetical protein
MSRLTDNDRHFGPVTYGRSSRRNLSLRFNTGGGEDEDGYQNHLWLQWPGWVATIKLPSLIKPWIETRKWSIPVEADRGETYTIAHGQTWGIDIGWADFLYVSFLYGPQTMDSSTTKRKGWFPGFGTWRHVRRSYYTPEGEHFYTEPKGNFMSHYKEMKRHEEACPKVHFQIEDYDGAKIIATCKIEEMEWRFGDKWFKWLSWFRRPKIRRSLDIEFDYELGSEKGSWKGGTLGHGIEMLPGEYPLNAFKRYCDKGHRGKYKTTPIKFISPCGPPEPRDIRVARNRGWKQAGWDKEIWTHKDYNLVFTLETMLEKIEEENKAHNAQMEDCIKAS